MLSWFRGEDATGNGLSFVCDAVVALLKTYALNPMLPKMYI